MRVRQVLTNVKKVIRRLEVRRIVRLRVAAGLGGLPHEEVAVPVSVLQVAFHGAFRAVEGTGFALHGSE